MTHELISYSEYKKVKFKILERFIPLLKNQAIKMMINSD